MIPLIVNDASCLIDLNKGGLLKAFCDLPYKIVTPLPVREHELIDFSESQWRLLDESGMTTHNLTPNEVHKSILLKKRYPSLSANDCFCLITAQVYSGILLTGDAQLRKVAEKSFLSVHGVLWVVDKLDAAKICDRVLLTQALKFWQQDKTVFLPQHEVIARLKHLKGS